MYLFVSIILISIIILTEDVILQPYANMELRESRAHTTSYFSSWAICWRNHLTKCCTLNDRETRLRMGGRVDMKVVMLGREAGGKTSLVHRYLYESFSGLKYQAVSVAHLPSRSLLVTPDCPLLSILTTLASLYLVSFQLARWFSVGFIAVPRVCIGASIAISIMFSFLQVSTLTDGSFRANSTNGSQASEVHHDRLQYCPRISNLLWVVEWSHAKF